MKKPSLSSLTGPDTSLFSEFHFSKHRFRGAGHWQRRRIPEAVYGISEVSGFNLTLGAFDRTKQYRLQWLRPQEIEVCSSKACIFSPAKILKEDLP